MLVTISKKKGIKMLTVVAISAMLFSFSSHWGGEGFQIFLNNKVVLQQFGNDMDVVKTLDLAQTSPNDVISVKYHHCGKIGKNRIITIKDEKDKVLKQWKFSNSSEVLDPMTCKVKDILGLKNGKSSILKLYYSSSELVKERQLASISIGAKSIARL